MLWLKGRFEGKCMLILNLKKYKDKKHLGYYEKAEALNFQIVKCNCKTKI